MPKQGVEDVLRDERMHMMELDPNADPVPAQDADGCVVLSPFNLRIAAPPSAPFTHANCLTYSNPVEPEEEAQPKHDTGMYGAVGDADGHVPKKRMSLVERFGKMFEAEVVCSKCTF